MLFMDLVQTETSSSSSLGSCHFDTLTQSDVMMQAINRDKNDLDAKWDKAVLHSEIDEPRKASTHILSV